jgi:5,10-methylenetetrahydrofolate reductase
MIIRKQVSVSPEVHDRFMREAKRLKVIHPKALADRIISQAFKDKAFYAALKQHFAK